MTYQKTNNISKHKKSNFRLSVQLSLSGLSFLVTDATTNKTTFFLEKEYQYHKSPDELLEEITSLFSEEKNLSENFSDVVIIYSTILYSLVPTPLFDEKIASEYLKLNSKILANDFVAYDIIENKDINIVYIPLVNINNYFFERFGNFKYYHATTLLLQHLLNNDKKSEKPIIYINVGNGIFDIIILKDEQLQLCNTYEYKTSEDFIYYILFCLEQLKLSPDTIQCILSGQINKNDPNFKLLYIYIRNIEFYNTKKLSEISEKDIHNNLTLKLAL